MKVSTSLKKLFICGVVLASLGTCSANLNNVNASSSNYYHVTRVSHNQVNYIYNKMMNLSEFNEHPNKSLENKFMAILPKLSNKQIYNFNGSQDYLNHHDRIKFNKIYNHEFNQLHPNAKFNSHKLYQLIISHIKNDFIPITRQENYDFTKLIPKLTNHQIMTIYRNEQGSSDNILQDFNNQISNLIMKRHHEIINEAGDRKANNYIKTVTITPYENTVATSEFNDVNKAREQYGIKPLKHSRMLQAVADMRAKQYFKAETMPIMRKYNIELEDGHGKNADNLAHGMDWHETPDDDAKRLGLSKYLGAIGGNAAPSKIGIFNIIPTPCGDPGHVDDNTTPEKIASNNVRGMMKYDKYSHNGHRQNILDKSYQYLAVDSYYDKATNAVYTIEDFC